MKESNNLKKLHSEISTCDDALAEMENLLKGFQNSLGDVSSEIRHLQEQSLEMKIKLRNRKACEAELRKFIDAVALPPDLIQNICDAEITETYLEYLLMVNNKMECFKDAETQKTEAFKDVQPELDKLRNKVDDPPCGSVWTTNRRAPTL